jgi:hypothetical protein
VVIGALQVRRISMHIGIVFHDSPSMAVCGEDCRIQVCPVCAPPALKMNVVDLIMQRTLGEVDTDRETLDELLITLPKCRHTFTVETLDGHCAIQDYFHQDPQIGKWASLTYPPSGSTPSLPPACPTCRSSITSPRYGRVFKRADLDILERNVASQMLKSLSKVQNTMATAQEDQLNARLLDALGSIKLDRDDVPKKLKAQGKERALFLKGPAQVPVPPSMLRLEDHGAIPSVAAAWRRVMRPLLDAYVQASAIAETRSPHVRAWEAAFCSLHEQEMNSALEDPAHAPRRPEEFAMRAAMLGVGLPKPRAEKRYIVEAFWLTLKIRFLLAELAQAWLDNSKTRESHTKDQRRPWVTFVGFLRRSCSRDAQIAYDIAKDSESRLQMTKTSLLIMRAEMEQFRFNIEMARETGSLKDLRESLVAVAEEKRVKAKVYAQSTISAHLQVLKSDQALEWLNENFIPLAKTIIEEWKTLKGSLAMSTFYQPVSLDEKESIIKAFVDFSEWGNTTELSIRNSLILTCRSTHGTLLQLPEWPHICDRRGKCQRYVFVRD